MTNYKNLVHFFGEMDLDLSKTFNQVYKKAFDISEQCGYWVTRYVSKQFPRESKITLYSNEGKIFQLWFLDKKFNKICIKEGEEIKVVTQIPSGEGTGYGGYFESW
jgi:hypothetical protein